MTQEQSPEPHTDPQTHLDTDPANRESDDDPAHDTGTDEGRESEGGATPSGPATGLSR